LLLIGDSGTGKTGALASLVRAGYMLRILDFDNGLDILVNVLKAKPELLSKVSFVTLTDKLKNVGGVLMPDGIPAAFTKAMNLLTNWKTADEDFGPVTTWGPDVVLVLDSLTFLSAAIFRYVEVIGNYKDKRQTYGEAQNKVTDLLGLLYSPEVKCNVIVTSHITFIETQANILKGYPSSIGRALSPQIPRFFNTVLQTKIRGAGATASRVISSVPDGLVDLKTPTMPGTIPAELPIDTGLADFFRALKGDKK
jgi:hypothetical protein